jgi:hypothetical protein
VCKVCEAAPLFDVLTWWKHSSTSEVHPRCLLLLVSRTPCNNRSTLMNNKLNQLCSIVLLWQGYDDQICVKTGTYTAATAVAGSNGYNLDIHGTAHELHTTSTKAVIILVSATSSCNYCILQCLKQFHCLCVCGEKIRSQVMCIYVACYCLHLVQSAPTGALEWLLNFHRSYYCDKVIMNRGLRRLINHL